MVKEDKEDHADMDSVADLGETIDESPLGITTDEVGELDETATSQEEDIIASTFGSKPLLQGSFVLQKVNVPTDIVERYNTGDLLGEGSGGSVFDLTDNNLGRTVAVKFLAAKHAESPKNIEKFMREALLTSRLDHPGILPVYDLEASKDNQLYFTMKKVSGVPLSVLTKIDFSHLSAYEQDLAESYQSIADIINVFIRVGEVLSYAHSQKIIHRDIKPDNIMLGSYGEVRVVDWGVAAELNEMEALKGKMAGTPLYMSPEQARRDDVDERSDIYGIGSTLFHVLMKRPLMLANSPEEFWDKKRQGLIDDLSDQEKHSVPVPLMAICKKCIEVNPEDRYACVADFLQDLKGYQSGAMIGAHHYSVFEVLKMWLRENKQNLVWSAVLLLLALVSTAFFYMQSQREFGDWGQPMYQEDFVSSQSWNNDWTVVQGGFAVEQGRLVTKKLGSSFTAYYNKPIEGGVRFEFEGEMLDDSVPGDLSIVYSPDINDTNFLGKPKVEYYLQLGGQGNECAAIVGPKGRLDFTSHRLKKGVRYHIRGDIDGKSLRLYLDGELMCSYDLLFPLNSGYIGIYGFYTGKTFDDISIFKRELPEVVNIIKTADILFHNELYKSAARRYQEIARLHQDTDIGEESVFKHGLSLYCLGEEAAAFDVWNNVRNENFRWEVDFYKLKELYDNGEYNAMIEIMHIMYTDADTSAQKRIQLQWAQFLTGANAVGDAGLIQLLLAFRERYFYDDQVFSKQTYKGLELLGETDKALSMFPEQSVLMAHSLLARGRYAEVVKHYTQHHFIVTQALFKMARYGEIVEHFDNESQGVVLDSLLALGEYSEARMRFADIDEYASYILLVEGEYRALIARFPGDDRWGERAAHLALGDMDAYVQAIEDVDDISTEARVTMAFKKYVAGDASALTEIEERIKSANAYSFQNDQEIFTFYFMDAVLHAFAGNKKIIDSRIRDIWDEKKEMMGMRLWHNVGLFLGKLTEDQYRKQPMQHMLEHDFLLYKALHEDLYGDRAEAVRYYKKFTRLPNHKSYRNYCIQSIVDRRLSELVGE